MIKFKELNTSELKAISNLNYNESIINKISAYTKSVDEEFLKLHIALQLFLLTAATEEMEVTISLSVHKREIVFLKVLPQKKRVVVNLIITEETSMDKNIEFTTEQFLTLFKDYSLIKRNFIGTCIIKSSLSG